MGFRTKKNFFFLRKLFKLKNALDDCKNWRLVRKKRFYANLRFSTLKTLIKWLFGFSFKGKIGLSKRAILVLRGV